MSSTNSAAEPKETTIPSNETIAAGTSEKPVIRSKFSRIRL